MSMALFVLKSVSKLDSHHQEFGSVSFAHPFSEMLCDHLIAMKSIMENTKEEILKGKKNKDTSLTTI